MLVIGGGGWLARRWPDERLPPSEANGYDVERLTRDEQLELLDRLWDSLGRYPEALPLTQEQRRELDQRLDELERGGPAGLTWDEVVKRIRSK